MHADRWSPVIYSVQAYWSGEVWSGLPQVIHIWILLLSLWYLTLFQYWHCKINTDALKICQYYIKINPDVSTNMETFYKHVLLFGLFLSFLTVMGERFCFYSGWIESGNVHLPHCKILPEVSRYPSRDEPDFLNFSAWNLTVGALMLRCTQLEFLSLVSEEFFSLRLMRILHMLNCCLVKKNKKKQLKLKCMIYRTFRLDWIMTSMTGSLIESYLI